MDDRAKAARTTAASDAPVQPTSVERPGEY
jgi:hypothetical protein